MARQGEYPPPWKQFWWDLLPASTPDRFLPRRSGIKAPAPDTAWLTKAIAGRQGALEQTRRAHDAERATCAAVESKASGYAGMGLTLLAVALALGTYQVGYLRRQPSLQWIWLTSSLLAVLFLSLMVIWSLEAMRVGIYQTVGAEGLAKDTDPQHQLIVAEEEGRQYARWTAGKKVDLLLQARAWLTRALVALMCSALITAWMATR